MPDDDPPTLCPVCSDTDRDCTRCGGLGTVPFSDLTLEEKDAWGYVTDPWVLAGFDGTLAAIQAQRLATVPPITVTQQHDFHD